MLSIERVKELLKDQNISDEEAKEIRDGFRNLAEIIFEQWQEERSSGKGHSEVPLNKSKNFLYDGDGG